MIGLEEVADGRNSTGSAHISGQPSSSKRCRDRIAFPLGGLGAGMVCFEGSGALSQVSLCNHPDLKNEPLVFAALALKGSPTLARVLEGPIPGWKLYPGGDGVTGLSPYGGLPRFKEATFQARFPFANLTLGDPQCSLDVQVAAWSPFEPGDADNSSLPVAAL